MDKEKMEAMEAILSRLGIYKPVDSLADIEKKVENKEITFTDAVSKLKAKEAVELIMNPKIFSVNSMKAVYYKILTDYRHMKPKGFSDGAVLYDYMVKWASGDNTVYDELCYRVDKIAGTAKYGESSEIDELSMISGIHSYLIGMVEGHVLRNGGKVYSDMETDEEVATWVLADAVTESDKMTDLLLKAALEEYDSSCIN